ncbi:hypothetical protein [Amycolatopsis sp.]|jgi:hypothetical protein|uniref:hypothetical protein n=1 Tax=Amycolatopsis sp. TaxID=37632 RepID=UPI002E0A27A6|nr:hypothetical protein [Amycolatopsis sp.]
MPDHKLGVAQRAALFALMVEAQEVSNPELKARRNLTIVGKDRLKLNEEKLVESWLDGRSYHHELTERGWKWCSDQLAAEIPEGAGSAERALYAVLEGIERGLKRDQRSLAEFFGPEAPALDLESRIRGAYRELADEPKAWVSLTDLRVFLAGAPKTEVDDVLRRMDGTPEVTLIPEANQRTLTAEDRAAAVSIGGEDNHLISIGEA